jgi:hypothetical protein
MLYYVMASSETLGDALQRAARYSRIVNDGMHLRYRESKRLTIAFEYVDVARHQDRHQIDFFHGRAGPVWCANYRDATSSRTAST